MDRPTSKKNPVTLGDLGFSRLAVAGTTIAIAIGPALLGYVFGLSPWPTLGIAGAGMLAAGTASLVAARHLRRALVDPLEALMAAMEQLRTAGKAPTLPEGGAPLLQPTLRRFNLAGMAIEQRGRQSLANLLSVEAAFDRVHAVLQSLREGVVVVDPAGKIVLANRNARRLLRFGEQRIEAEPLLDKVDGELRQSIADGLLRIDGTKVGEVHSADIVHGDRIFDLTIVQVQSNRPDQDFGKVVVIADVTRDHELNRLKDDLLSSISHELRTPLTNMLSSSEILTSLTPQDETEWREFAGMLNSESRRLKTLVDDVMEYSQLETQRAALTIERTELAALLRTAVEVVTNAAAKKHQTIECLADGPAYAMVDARRLNEAVCRVLDNAVKFTPDGGRIRVELRTHDGMIEVAIADSGPGVAPADRQRVFERFSQVGDVMTDKPQGTGLGLSITQRIIDAMGGAIWCEESPLGGAQFRFVVPQAEVAS